MLTTPLISLLLVTTMLADVVELPAPELESDNAGRLEGFAVDVGKSNLASHPGDGTVRIVAPAGEPTTVPLGSFPITDMQSRTYALQLTVDHSIVGQPAYFEMWTELDDGRRFFSKTLATVGPMKKLAGYAEGREIVIPASLEGSSQNAIAAELLLVMPSGGTVTLRKGGLVDLPGGLGSLGQLAGGSSPWLPVWFGAVFGSVFGVLCGCLGAFYSYSFRTGKLWELMQLFPTVFGVLSAVVLVAGIVAVALRQPYHVWYPLVLIGALGVMLAPTLSWQTKRQLPKESLSFEDRQMQAMDADV